MKTFVRRSVLMTSLLTGIFFTACNNPKNSENMEIMNLAATFIKEDKDFLHIHPLSSNQFPIYAQTKIEKPGIYRIWVEFQTNAKVHTATFTVNVAKGEQTDTKEHHIKI